MKDISNLKITLDRKGVRELLKSQEMMNICTEFAYRAQSHLGEGYAVTYMTGKNRVNASIFAETPEAQKENLKNNTILKALGNVK